jgi:hypothetical protein
LVLHLVSSTYEELEPDTAWPDGAEALTPPLEDEFELLDPEPKKLPSSSEWLDVDEDDALEDVFELALDALAVTPVVWLAASATNTPNAPTELTTSPFLSRRVSACACAFGMRAAAAGFAAGRCACGARRCAAALICAVGC